MNKLLIGDCRKILPTLGAESVQCVVTSPPYYALRDYGVAGQIGQEESYTEYVENLVSVFREVKRVLKNDGTLWLNLGDSYAGNNNMILKQKDLIGIPWRVAFALQADGWYLRQDIIWHKPNAMPESVKDRCVKSHEYIFLLSKRRNYYFDYEAIKEPAVSFENRPAGIVRNREQNYNSKLNASNAKYNFRRNDIRDSKKQKNPQKRLNRKDSSYDITKRSKRDVWSVNTRPYKGAHFAPFPPELITPCILAGSHEGDVVLDPFFGSGTVAEVAALHNRRWIGIDINVDYAPLYKERLGIFA